MPSACSSALPPLSAPQLPAPPVPAVLSVVPLTPAVLSPVFPGPPIPSPAASAGTPIIPVPTGPPAPAVTRPGPYPAPPHIATSTQPGTAGTIHLQPLTTTQPPSSVPPEPTATGPPQPWSVSLQPPAPSRPRCTLRGAQRHPRSGTHPRHTSPPWWAATGPWPVVPWDQDPVWGGCWFLLPRSPVTCISPSCANLRFLKAQRVLQGPTQPAAPHSELG